MPLWAIGVALSISFVKENGWLTATRTMIRSERHVIFPNALGLLMCARTSYRWPGRIS